MEWHPARSRRAIGAEIRKTLHVDAAGRDVHRLPP